ncbi:ATP-dependent DNA helicase [soil metagenome]
MLAWSVARLFPYQSYRRGQLEAIEAAKAAFARGKRFVVLEAPTGAGKSAIAVTLAREAASAYVLTAQKILQEQYLRDFPDLALMKGRGNYPCLVVHTHAAAAPCLIGRKFPQCDDCPYFVAKDDAMAASGVIMNYAYYLAELNYAGGFGPRELLVLDEAHNAEASLMGFIELTLSEWALARVGLAEPIPPVIDDFEYFEFAAELLPKVMKRGKELESVLKQDKLPSDVALAQMQNKQWLDGQLARLRLLEYSREENEVEWVVERRVTRDGQALVFKPVTVASFAEDFLFGFGEKVLMLSATILDPPTYLRSLGIPLEAAEIIRVASDFPPEHRPIYPRPVARMTRFHQEKDLPKLVAEIADLFDSHPGDKGLIHSHTYKIAAYIARNLPAKHQGRLVTHYSSEGRDEALAQHSRSPEPTVLLTPSMTEGIDLAGDLSRWQVICKVPYPFLGDSQVARRKALDAAWYDWRTCLTVVQAYGRSVRSRDDFAVTYVLDAEFGSFLKRQSKRLPEWFLEAVQE